MSSCYDNTRLRTVLTSRGILPTSRKDVLPIQMKSNIVYKFTCHCNKWYIGRTSQRLTSRIKEHVPKCVRSAVDNPVNGTQTITALTLAQARAKEKSSIAEHLLNNLDCLTNYTEDKFTMVATARSEYHLAVLESTYIMSHDPSLCKQKKFVYKLRLF